MKKILVLFLSIFLIFSTLVACNNSNYSENEKSENETKSKTEESTDEKTETEAEKKPVSEDPTIAYPTSHADYFDVKDFEIKKLNSNAEYEKTVGFSFVKLADRNNTAKSSKPYTFTGDLSQNYYPDFDKIDDCLLNLMKQEIVNISERHPTKDTLVAYGLMKKTVDENGIATYDFNSKYIVSYKRNAKVTVQETSEVFYAKILQTIYISEKNEKGNYYSYTTLTVLDTPELTSLNIDLDMICEVPPSTYDFLDYTQNDWIYPYFMESNIKYTPKLSIEKNGYSSSFDITKITQNNETAFSIKASNSLGKGIETFGIINVKDADNKHVWYVSEKDVILYNPNEKELNSEDMQRGTNTLGDNVRYLKKPFKTADGRIIYVNVDTIKIIHPNGETEEYVRYHSTIFKKLFQCIDRLKLLGAYDVENEEALISNSENLYATISLTDNENNTVKANFYSVTDDILYVTLNGEGGYSVAKSDIDNIFENAKNFYECKDFEVKSN